MKKLVIMLLCVGVVAMLAGCGAEEQVKEPVTMIANPWSSWASIEEAEGKSGMVFGLPVTVAGYTADEFSTMNGELIQIVYHSGDSEVCIRKQAGEGQDISGDYNVYENSEESRKNGAVITVDTNLEGEVTRQIISFDGYSWSVVAPGGIPTEVAQEFLDRILGL